MTSKPFIKVCDDSDPDWLVKRCDYVTGSEMATILGKAPDWMKKYQTYDSLVEQKRSKQPSSTEPTRRMLWGKQAEKGNIDIFAKAAGIEVKKCNDFLASKKTRIGSTLDGLVMTPRTAQEAVSGLWSDEAREVAFYRELASQSGLGVLEAKQSDGWKKQVEEWTEGCPAYYEIQVQTQLYVTGLSYGVIFCRLGVADMRAHVILPDRFLFEEMEEAVDKFWKVVGAEYAAGLEGR